MARSAVLDVPKYARLLAQEAHRLPEDVSFIVVLQREGDERPLIVHNLQDRETLGEAFRSLANGVVPSDA